MIRCITIDDEPLALMQMEGYIKKTPYLELVGCFDSALKALGFLQGNQVDLMFVDINMPDLSGMDFVKSLSNPPKIIFTTAYSEYALEGFRVDAADYLLKPISYMDFLKATDKVKERYFQSIGRSNTVVHSERYLFIKSEYKIIKVFYDDIKYIEGMREYVGIYTEGKTPIMALMGMKKMAGHLPPNEFMRVHRSFIVNLNKIQTIDRNRIVFDNKVYIPIGEQYRESFQRFLDDKFLK